MKQESGVVNLHIPINCDNLHESQRLQFKRTSTPIHNASVKSPTHYTQNCKKCNILPCTLQLFSTSAMIIPTVLHMCNGFHNNFI